MTNETTAVTENLSGKTALVVDDGPIERLAGKAMLQKMGLAALVAASGEEALRVLGEQRVDIVVCDISMPGMSGLEVLDAARRLSVASHFIMVSSYDDEGHARDSLERGAAAYLVKPLRFDSLRDKIAEVFALRGV